MAAWVIANSVYSMSSLRNLKASLTGKKFFERGKYLVLFLCGFELLVSDFKACILDGFNCDIYLFIVNACSETVLARSTLTACYC